MNERDLVNHWAILIGINFYVKNPLKGCVRDVWSIQKHLEAPPTRENLTIKTFTASAPSDPTTGRPAEDEESWPTYENVTSSLAKITEEAKPGDFVYIHYSGHGTKTWGLSSQYGNKNTGDLALVLFGPGHDHGVRYLHGQTLASQLNNMVKKGLLVTLVLDCCFSGSVIRYSDPDGAAIRTVDYDPAVDAAYPHNPDTCFDHHVSLSTLRDARMLPNWLVEPNGYTIFTACGPDEIAQELKLEGEEKNGALSHFLLGALTSLKTSGIETTNQSLYQHLCVRFHASWPRQNPMRYGNKNLSFFGKPRSRPDMAFTLAFTTKDHRLCLEAGNVHGVCKDDEYALYRLYTPDDIFSDTAQASVKARVNTVRGLTSDLVEIDPTPGTNQAETQWKARPLTSLSPPSVFVRLMASVDHQSQWIAAAKQRRFLHLSTEDMEGQSCLFNVTRNGRNEYEILDGAYQKIVGLPTISLDRKGALDRAVDLLEHLATFKYIEGLKNRISTASFEESFKIHLRDEMGSDLEAGLLNTNHEDKIHLMVQNTGDKPIYLYIYDLGALWQIYSVIGNDGGGDYKVVLPKKEEEDLTLQMTVPQFLRDRGQHQCEDVLKVFITGRPTSFTPLKLPEIPISAESVEGRVRGDHNQLSAFLSKLATSYRGGENGTSDEEWVTRNFIIRTSCGIDAVYSG